MKRLLALLLAVAMLAAGSVPALAEGTAAGDTEEAPITVDGVAPGGTIETTWSIYFEPGKHSKWFVVETEGEIVNCTNENSEIEVEARVRDDTEKELVFFLKNPSISAKKY